MDFSDIYAYFLLAGVVFVLFNVVNFNPENYSKHS